MAILVNSFSGESSDKADISPLIALIPVEGCAAVSYTHLDVYKRQDQPDGRTGLFNLREKQNRLRDQSIFSNRIKEGSESNEYQTRAGKTELDSVGKGKDYERKYIDRMGK